MMRRASRWSSSWVQTLILVLIFLLFVFRTRRQTDPQLPRSFPQQPFKNSDSCPALPYGAKVAVAVKTGATEAAGKIPPQMQNTLRCVENVFLFSDLEQDIEGYHLRNALDTVSPSIILDNPDFEFYTKQQEIWKTDKNIDSLRGAESPKTPGEKAAWTLDKYKFLHVLEKMWEEMPGLDWYVLVDADTYIFWSNLLTWLKTLNPSKKTYFGSEVQIAGIRFAHGGSGITLSRASMASLFGPNTSTTASWDEKTHSECCGDLLLSMALKPHNVEIQNVFPVMSGERLATMPFGPEDGEYWCRPAVSMHHVVAEEMNVLGKLEQERERKGPLTHSELLLDLVIPSLPPISHPQRENWDSNLASSPGDWEKTRREFFNATSFTECAQRCSDNEMCFQYTHHRGKCYIGMSIRLGYEKEADEEGTWMSGWNRTRLDKWVGKQPVCGKGKKVKWPKQNG